MKNDIPSFDTLLRLAQQDPERLEQLREQLARDTIDAAPEPLQPRLRGLQFQIDRTRELSKTPLGACIKLSHMMHDSFEELRQALNKRGEHDAEHQLLPASAEILPFTRN